MSTKRIGKKKWYIPTIDYCSVTKQQLLLLIHTKKVSQFPTKKSTY